MPETEARPPAQNRHGGAPRGGRTSQGARHASTAWFGRASQARQLRLLGAPLPVWGEGKRRNAAPRARFSGQAKRWLGLFDIVRWESGEPQCVASCPGRVQRALLRERNETRNPAQDSRSAIWRRAPRVDCCAGSRVFAPAAPSLARDTRACVLAPAMRYGALALTEENGKVGPQPPRTGKGQPPYACFTSVPN
jgi:hypothetical protein